jgi:hypothetical protein
MRKTVLIAALLAGAIVPAEASAVPHITAPWPCGETRDYYHHSAEVSNALDFNLPGARDRGTPALASGAGRVSAAGTSGGYGLRVVVEHGGGWATLYAHLDRIRVRVGDTVGVGTRLGDVGNTGRSEGPHLHYEQRLDGKRQPIVIDGRRLAYRSAALKLKSTNCPGTTPPPTPAPPPPAPAPSPAPVPAPSPATHPFRTWGTGVRVRQHPSLSAPVVRVLGGPTAVGIQCQKVGDTVRAEGYVNAWWSYVPGLGGWLSNIYVDHPAYRLPGPPDCA